jgi:hypothetical protein
VLNIPVESISLFWQQCSFWKNVLRSLEKFSNFLNYFPTGLE